MKEKSCRVNKDDYPSIARYFNVYHERKKFKPFFESPSKGFVTIVGSQQVIDIIHAFASGLEGRINKPA